MTRYKPHDKHMTTTRQGTRYKPNDKHMASTWQGAEHDKLEYITLEISIESINLMETCEAAGIHLKGFLKMILHAGNNG